uniref:Uncharacterized protein n=1 Tax=Panagrolaimus sp. JU765 TaxID=591449 RepID=A0AC34Q871_9BILA
SIVYTWAKTLEEATFKANTTLFLHFRDIVSTLYPWFDGFNSRPKFDLTEVVGTVLNVVNNTALAKPGYGFMEYGFVTKLCKGPAKCDMPNIKTQTIRVFDVFYNKKQWDEIGFTIEKSLTQKGLKFTGPIVVSF